MEKIVKIIGNEKLISAFERDDLKTFGQIALKLYRKARRIQDKKEYLLSACLKYARDSSVDVESALRSYHEIHCGEMALAARAELQCSAKYIEEPDALRRYDMKLTAYDSAHKACMESGV